MDYFRSDLENSEYSQIVKSNTTIESKAFLVHGEVLPIAAVPRIAQQLADCKKPLCEDADLQCIVDLIDATLCEAVAIIESDPRGLFCYKFPRRQVPPPSAATSAFTVVVANDEEQRNSVSKEPITPTLDSVSSGLTRKVLIIADFDYSDAISEVRDFVSRWELSPDTKCVVISNSVIHEVPVKGTIYFVDAHFSRPTARCPNPLSVAKVRFIVTVSKLLLQHYPVMITYRFEGYNTLYYAVGERAINSLSFQRFYIDTILHTKLSFFAALSECRHGTIDKPKKNIRSKKHTRPNHDK